MSTETETLLAESLEALVAGQPFTPDFAGIEHRGRHLRRRAYTVRALAGTGIAVAVAAAALVPGARTLFSPRPATATGDPGSSVLYRLASISAAVPPLEGRYAVLTETDTDSRVTSETQRTSVIDTETGASTTYQHATGSGEPPNAVHVGFTGVPPVLSEGPDPTSTEAWFAALPTEPTALRAQLLAIAQQQATQAGKGVPGAIQPASSDDDSVYEEATSLLRSPLVLPGLRAALYQVLARTSGVTVNQGATDPAGRPAIVMTRTGSGAGVEFGQVVHNLPGHPATDVTYEDPATGAVLAQAWTVGGDTMIAVYQPATGSATIPPDPYPAG